MSSLFAFSRKVSLGRRGFIHSVVTGCFRPALFVKLLTWSLVLQSIEYYRVLVLKWRECCDLVNGTWTVYQTDYNLKKHTIQPVKKNKTEELAVICCMPHSWKIPKFQPLLKISLHCQDERVREFFLNDYYIYYFLVAKSMLRPYWRKTTEYRVSSNEGPRSYHVNQAPQFYLSSLS